ncbi:MULTISPECIES: hypothetical protein [unclassified Sphingomonas]|uniref:hypothetical protein n=1 Tax=unclassified Sphingomonas TaxID=196159 RepID=UPI00092C9877|nr:MULTISPECIES: hypothetical protein [unclassified Sphingomonas]OJU19176.1 MAG: hypothetical protein BGN95_20550 [Sphingomonas sp. 66-10]
MTMSDKKKDNPVEEVLDEALVDPASPANHPSRKPPQTIRNEPAEKRGCLATFLPPWVGAKGRGEGPHNHI